MRKLEKRRDKESEILLYQTKDGNIKISVRLEEETVWLSQLSLAELFETTKQNISLHIRNIFKEGELDDNGYAKVENVPPGKVDITYDAGG